MRQITGLVAALALSAALCGCAASRSTLSPHYATVENPASGPAVRIETVVDARVYEAKPKNPDTPSVEDQANLKNSAFKARAIGRKRGGYGLAMGDIVLPEGKTVSGLFADVVADAFRRSGYRVLLASDSGYDGATKVDISIKQYWSWFNPGFMAVTASNKSEVEVKAALSGLESGVTVSADAVKSSSAIFESDWQEVLDKGIDDFRKELRLKLPKP